MSELNKTGFCNFITNKDYGILFLRIGMSFVFLWFGLSQLIEPNNFVGWIPPEASIIPISSYNLVIINGAIEVFFGILLFIGMYSRISALVLGLHLLGISFTIGLTEIGVRDFGLSFATLSLVFLGQGAYALDSLRKYKENTL